MLGETPSELQEPTMVRLVDWEGTGNEVLRPPTGSCPLCGGRAKVAGRMVVHLASREVVHSLSERVSGDQRKAGPVRSADFASLLVRSVDPKLPRSPEWKFAGRHLADLAEWDLRMLYSMRQS